MNKLLLKYTGVAFIGLGLMMTLVPAPQAKSVPQSRDQITLSFASLVKSAAPAVVNIYAKKLVRRKNQGGLFDDPFFNRFFGDSPFGGFTRERLEKSLGSGVIVKSDGLIVTNHHVIQDAQEITVVLADRREFEAKMVVSDKKTDLAVLRIETDGEALPFLKFWFLRLAIRLAWVKLSLAALSRRWPARPLASVIFDRLFKRTRRLIRAIQVALCWECRVNWWA
jgi:S1-C subfamily serine protease